jgi:hypothetical protein
MRTKPIRSAIAAASHVLVWAFVLGTALPAAAQQDTAALTERLFAAVRANDIATVRLVLTNGADPMAVDANGQTPAGIAIDRGYFEIAHHVLGVRNQRQAFMRRDGDDELAARPGTRPASAGPTVRGEERRPEPSWRQNTAPGQTADIPSPRLSSPQEASVITPSMVITGPTPRTAPQAAAPKSGAAKGPVAGPVARSPAPPSQPALTNLPVLPAGAPNPFDPKSAEPEALPVLSSTAPIVAPEAPSDAEKSRETSSGNALSRFFNGISGVFGGGGS